MNRVSSFNFMNSLRDIINSSIMGHRHVFAVSLFAIISTVASTYFVVLSAEYISELIKAFKTARFHEIFYRFCTISAVGLFLTYTPKILFTAVLQDVLKIQFVESLRKALNLSYINFNSKTPGEIRYSIFIKAYAVPLCIQLVIFELSIMLGTIAFSFNKIANEVQIITAILFLLVPIAYLFAVNYFVNNELSYQTILLEEQRRTSSVLYDKLLNYEIIKTYNLEKTETISLYQELNSQTKSQIKLMKYSAYKNYMLSIILFVPYVILMFISNTQLLSISTLNFFKFTILYVTISTQLKRIGSQYGNLMLYLNQIAFLDDYELISETPQEEIKEFNNNIEFKNLTIFYKDFPVIKNINAQIKKGEKIAILGKNGTGKSTFIKTILGFTKYEGDMFIDGKNVKDLTNKSILKLISYIPQDDYTADDTVMENIKRGNPSATNEEILEVCKTFGAHDYFKNLENGYETEVGPRGNKLSGGQKQKLSIVRAAIKDGEIFILDEATASMDKNYENRLMPVLFKNLKDKTVIMIVHGKEHLAKFDRIFFFNEAALEATGSYDELIKNNENFRKLADYCNS